MTDDTNDTTDEQPDERVNNLYPTAFAEDSEDTGTLVVIADTGKEARAHMVAAAGETVAELNPQYPEDDTVLFCTYRNALDSHFGEAWRNYSAAYLAFQVGDQGVPVYSFPESRLSRKEAEFDEGGDYPETGTDDDSEDTDDD